MNKKYLMIISISILTFCLGFMLSKKFDDAKSSKVADLKISHTCLSCQNLKVQAVFQKGDTIAYQQIVDSIINDIHSSNSNYFCYSLVMANKYDYTPANYDVYQSLIECYALNNTEMDDKTKRMAQNYLERGAEKGDMRAIRLLKKSAGTVSVSTSETKNSTD